MNRVVIGLLTLSVMFWLGSEARAVDRIRIDSIEPSVVDRGGEFTLRGVDLLCSNGRAYSSQTRVQMQWSIGRAWHWRYVQMSVILDNEIKAHVPWDVAPREYTIYVVNHARSGALQCRSNPMTLTVRQPPPPAVAADFNQVMSNPCRGRDGVDVEDLTFHLPGTDRPARPACRYPMKRIQLDVNGRTIIYALTPIYLRGVTLNDQDMVIGLMRAESSGGPGRNRYLVQRLMKVEVRTGALTMVRVPNVESGTYKVAALYRFVRDRSLSDWLDDPFRDWGAARPLFVLGSNVVDLAVTNPGRR